MEKCLFTRLNCNIHNDDYDFFEKIVMRFRTFSNNKGVTIKGDSVMFNIPCVADNTNIPADTATNKLIDTLNGDGTDPVRMEADISDGKGFNRIVATTLRPYVRDVEKMFKLVKDANIVDAVFYNFDTPGVINIESNDLDGHNFRSLCLFTESDITVNVIGGTAIITSTNMMDNETWNSLADNLILDLNNVAPSKKFPQSFWSNIQGNIENLPYSDGSLRTFPSSSTSLTGDIANLVSNWRAISGLTSGSRTVGNIWISQNITVNGTPLQTYLANQGLDPTAVMIISWDASSFTITQRP